MKVQILSDLHIEFQMDSGETIIKEIKEANADLTIIAGDLAPSYMLEKSVYLLTKELNNIIYVPGNHDYYFSSITDTNKKLKKLERNNFTVLNREFTTIGGQRFIGANLWYKICPEALANMSMLNDFNYIGDSNDIFMYGKLDHEFLYKNVKEGDIVITHVLPSEKSVAEKFKKSELNYFFMHGMDKCILKRKPKLWVHGHTHTPCDYMLGKTRVICNPLGYALKNENPAFNPTLVLDI